jgi:quercetin dioxygenase-like cupin family protein
VIYTSVDTPAGGSSPFHRTESIDYIIVLDGEIILELENNEQTVLKAGDVAIQQGTYVLLSKPRTQL